MPWWEAAPAYPGQVSLSKGQILLLPKGVPLEKVLVIQQQQLGRVLVGPGSASPLASNSPTAPALPSSSAALS